MFLRRIGSKNRIANKIIKYFPAHSCYIEPFFGAGGIFFNKPIAKYNFLNDLDGDVYNCFTVLINQKNELLEFLNLMPADMTLFKYWVKNKETDAVRKAARFLFLSNFSLYGMQSMFRLSMASHKKELMENLHETYDFMINSKAVYFSNLDFRKFINKLSFKQYRNDKKNSFIYLDPPYLQTVNNYSAVSYTHLTLPTNREV